MKSKAGEVQRRLDHAKTQLTQLARRNTAATERRTPIRRLERYGKLESDVMKAGDEIRALARFSGTQRTAFRKLLKKFKKWTGSSQLEERFREEVLDDPKSFTQLDLGPTLDEYSATLQRIRSLYEARLGQNRSPKSSINGSPGASTSALMQLQNALQNGSKVGFDTAIATVPLGEQGEIANYFVHPENVVELQVLLLQRMEYYTSRSRSNSAAATVSTSNNAETSTTSTQDPDYFMLIADNPDRFAHEQSALTIDEREHAIGVPPQKAKAFVRWNNTEDPLLSTRAGRSKPKSAVLKRKRIDSFFEREPKPNSNEVSFANGDQFLKSLRDETLKDGHTRPLFRISSCRSRFTGIANNETNFSLATLDAAVTIEKAGEDADTSCKSSFPFAVLQVRQEGPLTGEIIASLDRSHLVERVRGFSLEYHALWQLYQPSNISPPFWMPILSRDIRKLPPPAIDRAGSAGGSGGSGSQSATRRSISTPNSVLGITDTTTAVETERQSSTALPDLPEVPLLKAFRKKRRRTQAEREERQQRYWSEYDHPEDGEGGDAYVLYLDPNEKSTLDRMMDKIRKLWNRSSPEEEALLDSPNTPDNEESSDEEQATSSHPWNSYGTLQRPSQKPRRYSQSEEPPFLPPMTITCLVASVAILIVAYILKTTSKHKYAAKVDAGIIFAIACSIAFAVIGFGPLMSRKRGSWSGFIVAGTVLLLDAIFSGYLLAWMLG